MSVNIQLLDPETAASTFGQQINRTKSEVVIYYRKADREGYAESGWITWGDTQAGKQLTNIVRGMTALPQFGRIWDRNPAFKRLWEMGGFYRANAPWGPILSHPDGPAVFPIEQIKTYRWYKPSKFPIPGLTERQIARLFPQLREVQIEEIKCPDCPSREWFEAIHMMRHLLVLHGWPMVDILKLGERMGIDFTREFAAGGKRIYRFDGANDEPLPFDYADDEPVGFSVSQTDILADFEPVEVPDLSAAAPTPRRRGPGRKATQGAVRGPGRART